MKYVLALAVIAVLALGVAYWMSPLHTFNTLVPKDANARKVAEGLAYGEHPRQRLDIYAPVESPDVRLPVIVFFYGGSWDSGTRTGYDFAGRALAAQGFVVVVPDYRLVPEVRYPGFVEDGAAALRWVAANVADHGGDPERVVLSGHSAGAHIAAMLTYDKRWLGEAHAMLRGFAGLAGPYDFLPLDTASTRAAFGEWPDLPETQPITWADAGDPPALLLTGEEDTTVKPRNSRALAAALEGAGVDARVIEYEDLDHIDILVHIARPLRSRSPVMRDLVGFVQARTRQ